MVNVVSFSASKRFSSKVISMLLPCVLESCPSIIKKALVNREMTYIYACRVVLLPRPDSGPFNSMKFKCLMAKSSSYVI